MVTKIGIITHHRQDFAIIIKNNITEYIRSELFFQLDKDRLLYSILFYLENLNYTKIDYKICKKHWLLFNVLHNIELN